MGVILLSNHCHVYPFTICCSPLYFLTQLNWSKGKIIVEKIIVIMNTIMIRMFRQVISISKLCCLSHMQLAVITVKKLWVI